MKKMILLFILLLGYIECVPELTGTYSIKLAEFNSFVQSIRFTENEVATGCVLRYVDFENITITTRIDMSKEIEVLDPQFDGRMFSLGRNICGLKINNYNYEDPYHFYLDLKYKTSNNVENEETLEWYISTMDSIKPENSTTIAALGGKTEIKCALTTSTSCYLYNPSGKLVLFSSTSRCNFKIEHITIADVGAWKCVSISRWKMEQFVQYITIELPEMKVETWYNEENGKGMVGCKYVYTLHEPYLIAEATFIRPDGGMIRYTESSGITNERYTFQGTNSNERKFQIEFPLPASNSEIGTWKCILGSYYTGNFIDVRIAQQNPLHRSMNILTEESGYTIFCQVPYSTDSCVIKSPNGIVYSGGTLLDFWRGACSVQISRSEMVFGIWECHFSDPNNVADDVLTREFQSYDQLSVQTPVVDAEQSGTLTLMCQSGSAIYYCRFEDPAGKVYHISDETRSSGISYYGRGLNMGDCGMTIENVEESANGNWMCVVKNKDGSDAGSKELIKTLSVEIKSRTTIGAGIGVLIGLSVVAFAGIVVLLFTWYRNKKRTTRNSQITEMSPINERH